MHQHLQFIFELLVYILSISQKPQLATISNNPKELIQRAYNDSVCNPFLPLLLSQWWFWTIPDLVSPWMGIPKTTGGNSSHHCIILSLPGVFQAAQAQNITFILGLDFFNSTTSDTYFNFESGVFLSICIHRIISLFFFTSFHQFIECILKHSISISTSLLVYHHYRHGWS